MTMIYQTIVGIRYTSEKNKNKQINIYVYNECQRIYNPMVRKYIKV